MEPLGSAISDLQPASLATGLYAGMWEFPTIRGSLQKGSYYSGTILGSPIFGNSYIGASEPCPTKSQSFSNHGNEPRSITEFSHSREAHM